MTFTSISSQDLSINVRKTGLNWAENDRIRKKGIPSTSQLSNFLTIGENLVIVRSIAEDIILLGLVKIDPT
ncbi:hypothetical protein Glove_23g108 [Diversispora epigaea]|uniref:Uncharacterized protein n=1 Tax=Diversispora epigaea TaxID=1348612 RepID=A0A397JTX4_9GLOM|nr:hypothetical protein Glove_23g108 [Diversispora epigaea]